VRLVLALALSSLAQRTPPSRTAREALERTLRRRRRRPLPRRRERHDARVPPGSDLTALTTREAADRRRCELT
jgi:hypothetical protein